MVNVYDQTQNSRSVFGQFFDIKQAIHFLISPKDLASSSQKSFYSLQNIYCLVLL
jgi:hypothetical protein